MLLVFPQMEKFENVDIMKEIKKYLELSIEYGNHLQNTKYCILYMLKTHKDWFDTFKKVQVSKTLENLIEIVFDG